MSNHSAEGQLGDVLDRMADALFGVDSEWQITYANDRGRTILCEAIGETLTADELVGRHLWDSIPEAVATTFYERYHEAMETQTPVSFDEYYRPLERWFDVRAYPSETGLTVYFRDVTRERRQQEQLRERERVLREMYATIADRSRSFEEQVDELLRIGQETLGTSYGTLSHVYGDEYVFEVVRAPDDSIRAGDTVNLDATNCERVVLSEETVVLGNVERDAPKMTDRAGFTEWGISCYLGSPVVVDGETYGTFCFYDTEPRAEPFSDWEVTLVDLLGRWVSSALERKLAQERLVRQNERLEQFAAMVSHDLRNPLSIADGWVEQARAECDSEALERVSAAHKRMDTLISDILSLARAGQTVDGVTLCDVPTVAREAWGNVPTGDATLDVRDEFAVPADESRFQQLLENLVRNSVEHGSTSSRPEADDSVEHGGSNVTVSLGTLGDGFYVEDTGPGIPPDERELVFEFGYSDSKGGTGQGLSIVEQIAEAHGWSVRIVDGSSGGARFEFTGVR